MFVYGTPGRASGLVCDVAGTEFTTIDLETTGFSQYNDRIIEVGMVRTRGDGSLVEEWSTLVDPQRPIRASEVHRISETDVDGAPIFADVASEILRLMSDAIVVAHNAPFEGRFLAAELANAVGKVPQQPAVCTKMLAESVRLPVPNRKLETCCSYLGISLVDAHAALADAQATAELLPELLRYGTIDCLTFSIPLPRYPAGRSRVAAKLRGSLPQPRPPLRTAATSSDTPLPAHGTTDEDAAAAASEMERRIRDRWPDILLAVKRRNENVWALLDGAAPTVHLSEDVLTLGFSHAFLIDALTAYDGAQCVSDVLDEVVEMTLHVEPIERQPPRPGPTGASPATSSPTRDKPDRRRIPTTTARFASRCPVCPSRIQVGDELIFDPATKAWRHSTCPAEP